MPHLEYKFDKNSLSHTPVEKDFSYFSKKFMAIAISAVMLAVVLYFTIPLFSKSVQEKELMSQNKILLEQYQKLNKTVEELTEELSTLEKLDDSVYRPFFGEQPLNKEIRDAGTGGHNQYEIYKRKGFPEITIESAEKIDRLNAMIEVQKKSYNQLLIFSKRNQDRLKHLPAIIPIHNNDLSRTGSGFGMRFHPVLKVDKMHYGIDFVAPAGTPVYATADGKVKIAHYSKTLGKMIIIDHGYGIKTVYGHLKKYNVKKGKKVKRGYIIGYVGNTGELSTGAHLHYEVHVKGKKVDPVNYFFADLTPEQYQKIVEISSSIKVSMD